MKKIKIGIIGCGKVTETFHLPALERNEHFEVAALVDLNLPKVRLLASQYNVPIVEDDYKKILGKVDAVVIALPHHLHAHVGMEALQNGVHTLIEKPMAMTRGECNKMIRTAESSGVVLSVGLLRRYYEVTRFIKKVIESQMLGQIISFDFREGAIFSWAIASDFMFQKSAGGGVLSDTGAHTIDTLLWWLGDIEDVIYYDDAMGGVEANAELHLVLQNGVKGVIELSRTRNLRNTYILYGELGRLEIGLGVNPEVKLYLKDVDSYFGGSIIKTKMDRNNLDVFVRQLDDFAGAIIDNKDPYVTGREGARAVEIIEICYKNKRQLHEPWMEYSTEVSI